MSAIALFYLIQDEKRGDVIEAAMAQSKALTKKRFGFLPPKFPLNPDPFWEFLRTDARELEDYPFSGFLLVDLELLAPDTLASKDEVGMKLTDIAKSSYVSYRPADASRAIEILNSADLSDETIRDFLAEEGREHEYPDIIAPLRQSVEHLKKWLGQVSEGYTGILSIG
ncbi:MAG TPA: hypothetical protein VGE67_02925 [Haloferula sp.]